MSGVVSGGTPNRPFNAASLSSRVVVAVAAFVVCPVIAAGITSEGAQRYVALAAVGLFTAGVLASGIARSREIALWLTLLACVLNFLPALLSPLDLDDQPPAQRVVRDLVLLPLVAMALLGAWGPEHKSSSAQRLSAAFTIALWLLGIVMLIDLIVRGTDELSFLIPLRYFILYPAIALVVWRLGLSTVEINRLVLGIVWLGVFEGCVAVLDLLGVIGNTLFDSNEEQLLGLGLGRAIGTLGNPNNLGLFLGLPAFLLIGGATAIPRTTRIALLTIILVGIGTTLSKTAPAALVLALALQSVLGRGHGGRWVPTAGLVAVMVPLMYLVFSLRIEGAVSLPSLFGGRAEAVPAALRDVVSQTSVFVFGHGYGSQLNLSNTVVTDNMPLSIALEGGILGLGLFTAVVGAGIATVARAVREVPSPVARGLFGYCLFFLMYSLVAGNFRLFPGALLFWISVGLSWTLLDLGTDRREASEDGAPDDDPHREFRVRGSFERAAAERSA